MCSLQAQQSAGVVRTVHHECARAACITYVIPRTVAAVAAAPRATAACSVAARSALLQWLLLNSQGLLLLLLLLLCAGLATSRCCASCCSRLQSGRRPAKLLVVAWATRLLAAAAVACCCMQGWRLPAAAPRAAASCRWAAAWRHVRPAAGFQSSTWLATWQQPAASVLAGEEGVRSWVVAGCSVCDFLAAGFQGRTWLATWQQPAAGVPAGESRVHSLSLYLQTQWSGAPSFCRPGGARGRWR
jgi:hypothetical protein